MRHLTPAETRVFAACTTTPARVEAVAARAYVSVKTTRGALTRLVSMKLLTQTKIPGLGGPRGYARRRQDVCSKCGRTVTAEDYARRTGLCDHGIDNRR